MNGVSRPIPKLIHYVWVGPKNMPEDQRLLVESWSKIMPDWKVICWNERNLDFSSTYMRQAYTVGAWNRVSDFARGLILAEHGGVYLDTDVELIRPLDDLCEHRAFLGFQYAKSEQSPYEDWVNGAVFGATPGHWIPRAMMDRLGAIPGYIDRGAYSGPGLLTVLLREAGLSCVTSEPQTIRDVLIFPAEYFYPYPWDGKFEPDLITAETRAIHRWAASWVSPQPSHSMNGRQRFWHRAARRLLPVAFPLRRWLNNHAQNSDIQK